ncbi:MAG: molybdate transport system regulatory protein [Sulfurimonas sp.]|jgi:molybdate transport system regulatory protein
MSDLEEKINKYLNEQGKLDCKDAFKISAQTKTPIGEVGQFAKDIGIRIAGCELGQFGNLKGTGEYSEVAQDRLKPFLDEKNRVTCKDARAQAGSLGLKKIRGTLKEKNIDVTYCELGCFKEKKRSRLYVKTKTWIENQDGDLLFGDSKTEVLEHLEKEGSIEKAAAKIGISYEEASEHITLLRRNLHDDLMESEDEQGLIKLTPKASQFLQSYNILQKEMEEYSEKCFKELFLKHRNK